MFQCIKYFRDLIYKRECVSVPFKKDLKSKLDLTLKVHLLKFASRVKIESKSLALVRAGGVLSLSSTGLRSRLK